MARGLNVKKGRPEGKFTVEIADLTDWKKE